MTRRLGRLILRITRWTEDGAPPPDPKFVMIAAPHTSNWDLLYMLAFSWYHDRKLSWLGKDSLFRGPAGWVLRRLGGIPVDRSAPQGLVETMRDAFASADRLVVGIPPEGTRGRRDHWKSGFYRIAVAAEVPIVCGFLDYSTRTGGFGPMIRPTGDVTADMDVIRSFYAGKTGKYPDDVSEMRLRDEDV
ncbi:MAG: lysophospholipid acyltransferase family protein [Actinomycetota bacterium]